MTRSRHFAALLPHRRNVQSPLLFASMHQSTFVRVLCATLLLLPGMAPAAARSPTVALRTQPIHGASTVPFHRSALLPALVDSKSSELEGRQNPTASSPVYFVEAYQAFQSQAAPRQADDSSFDGVLATVEAAQVQLVNGQPGPFKALWSHGEDVTLVGGLG
jgi:hypothetical protein